MGLRAFLKRVLPTRQHFQEHKHFQVLGDILHDPNIFHLTRYSAAGGVAVGLFLAFIPVPGQMLIAAVVAVLLRVNLPLSVALVWISNPVTIPPLMYIAYKIGAFMLQHPHVKFHFEFTLQWFEQTFAEIWQPLLLGCLTLGIVSSLCGYLVVRLLWRLTIIRKWEERKRQLRIKN